MVHGAELGRIFFWKQLGEGAVDSMISSIPITLVGKNLGERHRHLNALVNDAFQKEVPFRTIRDAPEHSAVDRLFKIDLASKHRHLEYILANLKDDDMLYVSRALRSTWLLEPQYRDVINPAHLQDVLYPEMTTTAENKMINWLHVHLKDSSRFLEFFQYYFSKNMDLALKFFWNCPEDVIAETVAKILKKVTPKRMKLLCEKCPRAVRIYYELMPKNRDVLYEYLQYEGYYYLCLTNLINTDSDLLLDIAEKYYNYNCCGFFSSTITQVIMDKHKDRFVKKPELYAAWFLHLPTLAKCLSSDEIKDLVLKLARAEYLGSYYFSYKRVEPLIKRLDQEERAAFKKLVFTDKCIGEKVKEWPYEPPSSPNSEWNYGQHVFDDKVVVIFDGVHGKVKCMKRSAKCQKFRGECYQEESLLDKLFNKYRCISFKNTFMELSKKIPAESSVQAREFMMLVLVSKTGGHAENLKDLLELLVVRHNNEAENFRATIVRSLVKRAKVWQLPSDLWQQFVMFAHGLGLDGERTDENCDEGLHAVVIRSILLDEPFSTKVFSAFINKFSTLAEYTLNENEKRKIADKLPMMLLASAKDQTKPIEAVTRVEAVMKILHDYNLSIIHCPGLIPTILNIANKDPEPCVNLLKQLYEARLARKDLYRENFTFLQSNESYLNVLRHDFELLMDTTKFEKLVSEEVDHDTFLRKLAIYFSESEGLAAIYLNKVETAMAKDPRADLSRSFAILAGSSLFKKLQDVDGVPEKTTEEKRLAVALRAYGHLARPKLNLTTLGWRAAGVKAVANQISTCSTSKAEEHMRALSEWPRAARLAFLLAERIGSEVEILPGIAQIRPTVAIKITLRYLKHRGEEADPKVWAKARSLFEKIDLSQPKHIHLRDRLTELSKTPESLRADYGSVVYRAFRKVSRDEAMRILVNMEDYLPKADEDFLVDVIQDFLDNELTLEKSLKVRYPQNRHRYLIMRMIAKYLLLCKSEEVQKRRMETIGKRFLIVMKIFFDEATNAHEEQVFRHYWDSFMYPLKFTEVFLDTSYVSPLPVMQQIVEWLKELLPIVKHFDVYVTIHLIMLYFKAIRQGIKQNAEIFKDEAKRKDIGIEIVGVIYGKYIAHEIIQLKKEYFESIVLIYADVLVAYFSNCFYECKTFPAFASALIRGMLEGDRDSSSLLLTQKVFLRHRHALKNLKNDKSLETLRGIEDKQLKFFLHAELEEQ